MKKSDTTKIVLFKNKQVRKTLYNNEWYFSVIDIIEVLTDSNKPRDYWYAMKTRVKLEDGIELSTICRQLKLLAPDGKMRETDCANTEDVFRIVQYLRDHMDDFELIFNMLGEKATTEIHRTENSKGVPKLKADAKAGGNIAGGARKKLEKRLGRSIVTKKNFLKNTEGLKKITN